MITIKASASGASFNYNAYTNKYFEGAGSGNPDPFESNIIGMQYADEKVLNLRGSDFAYDYRTHIVSGTLNSLQFTEGGDTILKVTGLSISNPSGEAGEFHDLVASLMGGGAPGTGSADPSVLRADLASEAQHYVGYEGKDIYKGTQFGDEIEGRFGNDRLTGGGGEDSFVFNTKLGSTNIDRVADFSVEDDTIELSAKTFKGLKRGELDSDSFVIGTEAKDSDDHVIYDPKTGALYYDADGAGGQDAVKFAILDKNLDLSHDDFLVV